MFFAKIVNTHHAKNRLQTYLAQQLTKLECLTVEDPSAFKQHLDTKVALANQTFRRCHPVTAYLRKGYRTDSEDLSVGVGEVIEFKLYQQRGVFKEASAPASAVSNDSQQASLFN